MSAVAALRRHLEETIALDRMRLRMALRQWDTRSAVAALREQDRVHEADTPRVATMRQHVERLLLAHAITFLARTDDRGLLNSYARPWRREIESLDVRASGDYASVLHEIGHVLHPCGPAHRRVSTGHETVCLPCELSAWRWALAGAIIWDRGAHAQLVMGLRSYRPYASPSEARDIDALIGEPTYRAVVHRLAVGQLEQDGIIGSARRARAATARRLKQHAEMQEED
ncbi:MAG: hypothetical protein H0X67_02455 [Acidobacteria bacterium]|nr:hypothetical protein [Acidobacteriota bacterium]